MYCPVSEDCCSENVRLVIQRTFIEYRCLDNESPKLRRHKSDPLLPALPSSEASTAVASSTCFASKCMEAPTPTTCASVNGDYSDEQPPASPFTNNEDPVAPNNDNASAHTSSLSSSSSSFIGSHPFQDSPHNPLHHVSCSYPPLVWSESGALPMVGTGPQALPVRSERFVEGSKRRNYYGMVNGDSALEDANTTLMLRNLPQELTQPALVRHFVEAGYRGSFDFIYMPMNMRRRGNFGYAFMNFKSHATAVHVMSHLQNDAQVTSEDDLSSSDAWTCMWSNCQGLQANVDRYRNSPLMHDEVPKECKPTVYDDRGIRAPFPRPTKKIAKPRIHRQLPRREAFEVEANSEWVSQQISVNE